MAGHKLTEEQKSRLSEAPNCVVFELTLEDSRAISRKRDPGKLTIVMYSNERLETAEKLAENEIQERSQLC